MKNTIKALSKQFFGAKYESARKSLLAAAILFIAIYAAEIRVAVAPAILYLTSTLFTAGVMWQVLTGRRQMEAMQGMLMLPFDHRGFVFGYVLVLGAHTLVTKTLLVWALFFAAASWNIGEITLAVLCGCMACAVTAAGYRMCRRGHAVLPLLWVAGILAAILLLRQWAAVLSAAAVSVITAVLYLAFADAYDFYSAGVAKKAVRHTGRTGNVFTYLLRYLMANKTYLINTAGLAAVAGFLPLLFGEVQGMNMFPIGLAILCLNTPICTLLSCDPDLEQAIRVLPGQAGRFWPKVLPVYLRNQQHCRLHLPLQLAAHQRRRWLFPWDNASSVCFAKRHPFGRSGVEVSDPWLENRKRSVASSPQISRSADYAAGCSTGWDMAAGSLDLGCGFADGVLRFACCDKERLTMKNSRCCPKCHSENIVRVPDHPARHASGNNIYTTRMTLFGKIPVIRYVCCNCGYVENWVENAQELDEIKKTFG